MATGKLMYSEKQFRSLEVMCRQQARLARNEMEYSLMIYWLVEAEEWKKLIESDPLKQGIANRSAGLTRSSSVQFE